MRGEWRVTAKPQASLATQFDIDARLRFRALQRSHACRTDSNHRIAASPRAAFWASIRAWKPPATALLQPAAGGAAVDRGRRRARRAVESAAGRAAGRDSSRRGRSHRVAQAGGHGAGATVFALCPSAHVDPDGPCPRRDLPGGGRSRHSGHLATARRKSNAF